LILHTAGKRPAAGYVLEISSAGGKLIFRGRGKNNTTESGLTVTLSHHLIPAGRYSIKLYALEVVPTDPTDPTDPIEQYVVEVRYH